MLTYLIIAAAFVCVTCLVGGVAMLMGPSREASVEERLDFFTATGPQGGKKAETKFLSSPLEETSNVLELYMYNNAFQYTDMGYASTVAMFLLVSLMALSLLQFRLFRSHD